MSASSVGVVIVTYNSAEVLAGCLRSLRGAAEVVVVDNASADESVAVAHQSGVCTVIANQTNRGFAAAVNQGVGSLRAPLLLVLNPDVVLQTGLGPDTEIVRQAFRAEVGLVGGRLDAEEGGYQHGFGVRRLPTPALLAAEALLLNRLWPGNPLNRRYRCADFDPAAAQECEQPAGAFLLFRRDVFDALGGFDESFFPLWFEDVDFCKRVLDAGYRIRYEPTARGIHRGGHSLVRLSATNRQRAWYGNLLRFAEKHFSPVASFFLRTAATAGLALRGIVRFLSAGRSNEGRACFGTIGTVWSRPYSSRDAGAGLERTRAA